MSRRGGGIEEEEGKRAERDGKRVEVIGGYACRNEKPMREENCFERKTEYIKGRVDFKTCQLLFRYIILKSVFS